ncbi:hypothetical protein NHJ6243_009717 [Beauveria neobassiana]
MEPGRVSWKAHLKGAGKILSLFQPTLARAGPLADYISADYLIHICCPPEILNVLLAAATLSNTPCDASDNEQTITAASTLFESAYTFDVDAWARDEDNFSYLRSATVQTRIHAGHAHRLAACLYILRAIPAMNSLQDSDMVAKLLASNAIQHISSIPDDDANLKVITWPTFVVGADSDDAARREWAMGRLRAAAKARFGARGGHTITWLARRGKNGKSFILSVRDLDRPVWSVGLVLCSEFPGVDSLRLREFMVLQVFVAVHCTGEWNCQQFWARRTTLKKSPA